MGMKKELSQWTKDRIAAGKRLTKSDMAYVLPALHPASLYPEAYKRDELSWYLMNILELISNKL
jgi:hypothetical protein